MLTILYQFDDQRALFKVSKNGNINLDHFLKLIRFGTAILPLVVNIIPQLLTIGQRKQWKSLLKFWHIANIEQCRRNYRKMREFLLQRIGKGLKISGSLFEFEKLSNSKSKLFCCRGLRLRGQYGKACSLRRWVSSVVVGNPLPLDIPQLGLEGQLLTIRES